MKRIRSELQNPWALPRLVKRVSAVVCLCILLGGPALSQPLALDASLVGSGGGEAAVGTFTVGIALGQTVVGTTSGESLSVALGLFADGEMMNVSTGGDAATLRFALDGTYPNPFRRSTSISYELPEPARVRLEVYDVIGRRVRTLVDGEQAAGRHEAELVAAGLASGAYFVRLVADEQAVTRQIQLVR